VGQTFLRGVQTTDNSGSVSFNTIYPGWYNGRATRIHVEVYVNGQRVKVTQMAFPESTSAQVYGQGSTHPRARTRRPTRATTFSPMA
jgi:protocatechuate 3,4-dioxygenase beta subunit